MKLASGGEVTLTREAVDDQAARYAAVLTTPEGAHAAQVSVALETGELAWGAWSPGEPPAWLLEYARQFLRSAWRARATTPWPERIHRWRGTP
jgi:hypothetical protein